MNTLKLVLVLVLTLALAALVLQNRQPVETRFLFFTVTMPQILLLLMTTGGGFCLGLLVSLALKVKGGTRP